MLCATNYEYKGNSFEEKIEDAQSRFDELLNEMLFSPLVEDYRKNEERVAKTFDDLETLNKTFGGPNSLKIVRAARLRFEKAKIFVFIIRACHKRNFLSEEQEETLNA